MLSVNTDVREASIPNDNAAIRKLLIQTAVWLAVTAGLLFVPAGTLRWPEAWLYLTEIGGLGLLSGLAMARHDPDLVRERMRGPIQGEQKGWDIANALILRPVVCAVRGRRA